MPLTTEEYDVNKLSFVAANKKDGLYIVNYNFVKGHLLSDWLKLGPHNIKSFMDTQTGGKKIFFKQNSKDPNLYASSDEDEVIVVKKKEDKGVKKLTYSSEDDDSDSDSSYATKKKSGKAKKTVYSSGDDSSYDSDSSYTPKKKSGKTKKKVVYSSGDDTDDEAFLIDCLEKYIDLDLSHKGDLMKSLNTPDKVNYEIECAHKHLEMINSKGYDKKSYIFNETITAINKYIDALNKHHLLNSESDSDISQKPKTILKKKHKKGHNNDLPHDSDIELYEKTLQLYEDGYISTDDVDDVLEGVEDYVVTLELKQSSKSKKSKVDAQKLVNVKALKKKMSNIVKGKVKKKKKAISVEAKSAKIHKTYLEKQEDYEFTLNLTEDHEELSTIEMDCEDMLYDIRADIYDLVNDEHDYAEHLKSETLKRFRVLEKKLADKLEDVSSKLKKSKTIKKKGKGKGKGKKKPVNTSEKIHKSYMCKIENYQRILDGDAVDDDDDPDDIIDVYEEALSDVECDITQIEMKEHEYDEELKQKTLDKLKFFKEQFGEELKNAVNTIASNKKKKSIKGSGKTKKVKKVYKKEDLADTDTDEIIMDYKCLYENWIMPQDIDRKQLDTINTDIMHVITLYGSNMKVCDNGLFVSRTNSCDTKLFEETMRYMARVKQDIDKAINELDVAANKKHPHKPISSNPSTVIVRALDDYEEACDDEIEEFDDSDLTFELRDVENMMYCLNYTYMFGISSKVKKDREEAIDYVVKYRQRLLAEIEKRGGVETDNSKILKEQMKKAIVMIDDTIKDTKEKNEEESVKVVKDLEGMKSKVQKFVDKKEGKDKVKKIKKTKKTNKIDSKNLKKVTPEEFSKMDINDWNLDQLDDPWEIASYVKDAHGLDIVYDSHDEDLSDKEDLIAEEKELSQKLKDINTSIKMSKHLVLYNQDDLDRELNRKRQYYLLSLNKTREDLSVFDDMSDKFKVDETDPNYDVESIDISDYECWSDDDFSEWEDGELNNIYASRTESLDAIREMIAKQDKLIESGKTVKVYKKLVDNRAKIMKDVYLLECEINKRDDKPVKKGKKPKKKSKKKPVYVHDSESSDSIVSSDESESESESESEESDVSSVKSHNSSKSPASHPKKSKSVANTMFDQVVKGEDSHVSTDCESVYSGDAIMVNKKHNYKLMSLEEHQKLHPHLYQHLEKDADNKTKELEMEKEIVKKDIMNLLNEKAVDQDKQDFTESFGDKLGPVLNKCKEVNKFVEENGKEALTSEEGKKLSGELKDLSDTYNNSKGNTIITNPAIKEVEKAISEISTIDEPVKKVTKEEYMKNYNDLVEHINKISETLNGDFLKKAYNNKKPIIKNFYDFVVVVKPNKRGVINKLVNYKGKKFNIEYSELKYLFTRGIKCRLELCPDYFYVSSNKYTGKDVFKLGLTLKGIHIDSSCINSLPKRLGVMLKYGEDSDKLNDMKDLQFMYNERIRPHYTSKSDIINNILNL